MYSQEQRYEIWLSTVSGMTIRVYERLMDGYGSAEEVFGHYEAGSVEGLSESVSEALEKERQPKRVDALVKRLDQLQMEAVTRSHPHYPEPLANINDAPILLFAKGNTALMTENTVAMVGSRHCTRYGEEIAKGLAFDLASNDVCIVSGLAFGIDACAHQGALSANGKTIAFLGGGLSAARTSGNAELYDEITEKGLILSEYFPDSPPRPGQYPVRNRLISGISYGTVVVEAALPSGTMITAGTALDQGREVFAVPGNLTSRSSAGANYLIHEGAHICLDYTDIMDEFGWPHAGGIVKGDEMPVLSEFSDDEKVIYDLLCHQPYDHDELIEQTGFSAQKVAGILTSLELSGIMKQSSDGKYYC